MDHVPWVMCASVLIDPVDELRRDALEHSYLERAWCPDVRSLCVVDFSGLVCVLMHEMLTDTVYTQIEANLTEVSCLSSPCSA